MLLKGIGVVLLAIGGLGFFAQLELGSVAGDWLNGVELPARFQTTTILLSEGGLLAGTIPMSRLQRYDSNGHFRNGWFVDAKGGSFAIGLTTDGKVAVCTARGREVFLFDLDGRPAGRQPCFGGRDVPDVLQPGDFPGGEIKLQAVRAYANPRGSWSAFLMVPLWHPFVAGLIGAAGMGLVRLARRADMKSPGGIAKA